jgi:hypothetical protein
MDQAHLARWTFRASRAPVRRNPVDPLPSLEALDRQIATSRAAFDENWNGCSAAEKQRIEKAPEPEREQWRRLSLAGCFRALEERIAREWPWR